jgi:hypothetical protein
MHETREAVLGDGDGGADVPAAYRDGGRRQRLTSIGVRGRRAEDDDKRRWDAWLSEVVVDAEKEVTTRARPAAESM